MESESQFGSDTDRILLFVVFEFCAEGALLLLCTCSTKTMQSVNGIMLFSFGMLLGGKRKPAMISCVLLSTDASSIIAIFLEEKRRQKNFAIAKRKPQNPDVPLGVSFSPAKKKYMR